MSAPHPTFTEQQLQAALDSKYRNKSPISTLWHLFAGRHLHLAMVAVLFVIKQSPVWVLPIITGSIVNTITEVYSSHQAGLHGGDATAIRWIVLNAAIMLVLVLQNVPSHTLYATLLSSSVRSVQLILRSALVVRLQQLSMKFHDATHSGKLQSKVLRDVDAVEGLSRLLIENLLNGSISLAIAITVTLSRAPKVALFFLAAVPTALLLNWIFRKPLVSRNAAFRREVEEMSGRVSEMIDMIPITRAHAVEHTEVEKLHVQLLRIRHAGQRLDTANNLFGSAAWAMFQSFQLICLMFNIWQCFKGYIKVGDVMMYQGFFGMIIGAVQGFLNIMPQVTSGVESIRSIGEVLESPDVEQNDGKAKVTAVAGKIEFEHVTFTYPGAEKPSIDDLSLTINAGDCIAVVGHSGSGKSTLMNLIIGFRRPTAGRVLLDGVDMATINFRSFRRFLAVVPQQTVLFSGTVRENITYGLQHVTDARLQEVLAMSNCADFVSKLPKGLDTPIGNHGGKLSGGQRQRIAIARAMLRDPRVIILDEATSALDVESEKKVQEALNRLIAGRTTFIVAHRLSTIRNANRVLVMDAGKIIEQGTHQELLSLDDGAFKKLHALQA